jgi:hypothetical protein
MAGIAAGKSAAVSLFTLSGGSGVSSVGTLAWNAAVNAGATYGAAWLGNKYAGENYSKEDMFRSAAAAGATSALTSAMNNGPKDFKYEALRQMSNSVVGSGMQKLFTGEGDDASFWGSVSTFNFWSNVGAERAERIQQEEKANNPQPERQSSGEQEGPWQAFWGSLGIVTGIRQTKQWLGEVSTSIASLAEKSMNFLGGDGFKSDIAVRGAADMAESSALWEKASKYMTMSPEMAFDNIVRQGYGFDENGKMVFAGLAGAAALASRGNGSPDNASVSQQPIDVFTLNVSLNASLSQGKNLWAIIKTAFS